MEKILEILKERFNRIEYLEDEFGCNYFRVYYSFLSKSDIDNLTEKAKLFSWTCFPTDKGLQINLYFKNETNN